MTDEPTYRRTDRRELLKSYLDEANLYSVIKIVIFINFVDIKLHTINYFNKHFQETDTPITYVKVACA